MSERLIKLLNDALIKEGADVLSERSGLAEGTIRLIAEKRQIPRRRSAYRLALACRCTEEDALAMAYECASKRAKEPA